MADSRILVVDDEESICWYCASGLERAGFAVEMTTEPARALALARSTAFDLFLTDIKMLGMGGLDLVQAVAERQPDVAVIFMTGGATLEVLTKAVRRGVYCFLPKPFELSELITAVRQALSHRRQLQDNIRLKTLLSLFDVSKRITAVHDPSALFSLVMEAAMRETGADRGEIYDVDEQSQEWFVRYMSDPADVRQLGVWKAGAREIEGESPQPVPGGPCRPPAGQAGDLGSGIYRWVPALKAGVKAHLAVPLCTKSKIKGVLSLRKNPGEWFSEADVEVAMILAAQAAVALENSELELEREILFLETIKSLAATVDERDPSTAGHSQRVARIAVQIGSAMGLAQQDIENLELAGNLHDIGKIGIPDQILLKAAPLTPVEYEIIKTHAERGYKILRHIQRLRPVVDAVHSHHEWHNGNGYPRGLREDDIPLAGAIISVSDALDTIVTDRPYRKRRSIEEALLIIEQASGSQFQPQVVAVLRKVDFAPIVGLE